MTFEIDPDTGLPKVGDREFWRVTATTVELWGKVDGEWEDELTFLFTYYGGWGYEYECRTVTRTKEVPRKWYHFAPAAVEERQGRERRAVAHREGAAPYDWEGVDSGRVSAKEAITLAAESVLRKVERRKLVGDYPPNKL